MPKQGPRPHTRGPRPHTWLVQGEIPHEQFICWQRAKAQAHFRGEVWLMSFEDYQRAWLGNWHLRGRCRGDVCLTREDPEGAWELSNVVVMARVDHLRRQRLYKKLEAL